ncbi:MAG: hypothetical protein ACTHMS_05670 [Jatrophihabitans sp.]|uniref:hypothetical protein n=1 Tax=Jatrophihabitans sp. TaxID=1932789 RepID=UPI003F7E27D2
MSADVLAPRGAVTAAAPMPHGRRDALRRLGRVRLHPTLRLPLLVSVLNAALFLIIQPDVADLQAALARGSATAHGVGLTYWFQWFGGGTTPGHYSVLSPWLSSWLTAPLLGALTTVALTPLADRVLARTYYQVAGTWVGTVTAGLNLWSGRIAFALGLMCSVVAVIGLRERRWLLAVAGTIASVFSSPVTGVFLGMALFATWLTSRDHRRPALLLGALCGATLLFVAFYYGSPGPQTWPVVSAILVTATSLVMLLARPAAPVRLVAWMTAIASPVLLLFPNGMGSNLARMPYVCLPVAVIATAAVGRRLALVIITPAVVICSIFAITDLPLATQPAASTHYYDGLARQLDRMHIQNYRLEVVQYKDFHTADYVLLDHAALATGWETQEQQELNPILESPQLDADTYHVWLDNNAVGYVAFDHRSPDPSGREWNLVHRGLPYLSRIWGDDTWTLYRVADPTPIVPRPATLLQATQSALVLHVPCACRVPIRVRWSKFLTLTSTDGRTGLVEDDLTGWTVVTTPAPGTYRLAGRSI